MPIASVVNNIQITEVFLWLLTFTEPSEDPGNQVVLRAVSNLENVWSNVSGAAEEYTAFPFEIILPPEDGSKPQNLKLSFPNVGRELMQLVREYPSDFSPRVRFDLVLASNTNIAEKTLDFMQVANVTYEAETIVFDLISSSIFARKTCVGTYNQAEFPALFWALR